MNTVISMNTKYIHGKITPIAADISQAFSNVECGNLYSRLDIREKTGAKFTKPNPTGQILSVVLGGWRLISQDREKTMVNLKEWLGDSAEDSLEVFVNKPSKGSQVIAYNGIVVAEVLDINCVNILTDLIKIKESCGVQTYIKLVNHIFYTYIGAFHDIDIERRIREKKENSASSMHNLIMHIRRKNVDEVKSKYNEVVRDIKSLEDDLIDAIKQRKELALKLDMLSKVDDEEGQRVKEEITRIMQLNHVIDINVVDSEKKINVMTDDIYVRNANKRYYIGMFRIEINLEHNRVRFFNLNNRRRSFWGKDCNHPHVSDTGAPCWGNAGDPIRKLLAEGEFLAAVSMMIGYLESVNTADPAGKNITRWDTVDEEGRVIIKGYDPSNPPEEATMLVCSHCGESKPMTDFSVRGYRGSQNICSECKDEVVICQGCGDYVSKAGAILDIDTNKYYCDYCHEDLIEEREMANNTEEVEQEQLVMETQEESAHEDRVEITGEGVTINGEVVVGAQPEVVEETEVQMEVVDAQFRMPEETEENNENNVGDDNCPFCNTPVNDDMWMTCEMCGTQGCSTCISFDGVYKCPNCR